MKKFLALLILLMVSLLVLINCKGRHTIFVYSPPEETPVSVQPYTIKVSNLYDTLFAKDPRGADQVQDFDFYGNKMYIWAYFFYGLYGYDLKDRTLTYYGVSGSGDYIAADSGRVFWGLGGCPYVNSYSPATSKNSLFLTKEEYWLQGMQVYDNKLYVLFASENLSPEDNVLDIYDLNGQLQETIPYKRTTWYATINRGILYSVAYDTVQQIQVISRFELSSGQFLKDVECPSQDCAGLRSYGDYFFFTDYKKRMIGYVSLDEIEQRGN